MAASVHLRGIVIAGALAALALGLGFVTLVMNQSASHPAPHVIIPLKDRHHAPGLVAATRKPASVAKAKKTVVVKTKKTVAAKAKTTVAANTKKTAAAKAKTTVAANTKKTAAAKAKKKVTRPDPNLVAALKAGLPRGVAAALAKRPVVVVELWSSHDPVAKLASAEAEAGAALAGAAYVGVNVDQDGGAVADLTKTLGKLAEAPTALVYARPATLALTLTGFVDRTAVQQAASSAAPVPVARPASAGWADKANAICSAANAKIDAIGVHKAAALVATTNPSPGWKILSEQTTKLAALTPPAGSSAEVAQANAVMKQAAAVEGRYETAIFHGERGAPTRALGAKRVALDAKWHATYEALGATICAAQ
jgi:hypothetical protein